MSDAKTKAIKNRYDKTGPIVIVNPITGRVPMGAKGTSR